MIDLNEIKKSLKEHEIDNENQYYGLDKDSVRSLIQTTASLVEQVEGAKADALQIGRNWQNDRHELFKALEQKDRQIEELQKTLEALHTYYDFEEPVLSGETFHFDDASGVNEAHARAFALIKSQKGEPHDPN